MLGNILRDVGGRKAGFWSFRVVFLLEGRVSWRFLDFFKRCGFTKESPGPQALGKLDSSKAEFFGVPGTFDP